MWDKDKILSTYIHGVNISSELHGERRDSVETAAALYNRERQIGGKDFGFAVFFFFFFKRLYNNYLNFFKYYVCQIIPCGDKPIRQLSFKKIHMQNSQCNVQHISSAQIMMSLLFVSITKFVFISTCAYCLPYLVHSRYSRQKPPREPQSQPKSGKTRLLKWMPWHCSWLQQLEDHGCGGWEGWGVVICWYPSVGDGLFLSAFHCSRPDTVSLYLFTHTVMTSVPLDVTKGSRSHGAPYDQRCQACQARTLYTSSPRLLPAS